MCETEYLNILLDTPYEVLRFFLTFSKMIFHLHCLFHVRIYLRHILTQV